jgi:predicted secreted Zn-dependent protease
VIHRPAAIPDTGSGSGSAIRPKPVRRLALPAALVLLSALLPAAASAGGSVSERVETYAVSGSTGAALYESIGLHGPKAGGGRAIAHTGFRLTWRRDYQNRGSACVLASAVPKLVITTTLPKTKGRLSPEVAASWKTFIDGVAAHERVHGQHIREMVEKIEAASIGLSAENDPKCAKVRATLQARLKVLSDERVARERDFDRAELSPGGTVHQLILTLVNGP